MSGEAVERQNGCAHMKPLLRAAGRTLLCAFVLLTQPVWAAQPWEEYSKLIKSREHITAEGPQLFGDAVNLYTGELSFAVSDVSIPGNNNLPVALGRKYAVPGEGIPNLPMGDWDIDIPYLGGTFEHYSGWNVHTPEPMARCSSVTSVAYAATIRSSQHTQGERAEQGRLSSRWQSVQLSQIIKPKLQMGTVLPRWTRTLQILMQSLDASSALLKVMVGLSPKGEPTSPRD